MVINNEYKLDNGLVVALQNTPTKTVAVKLRVNYGSSYEKNGEEGLAHFLEHCLVTGGSLKYDPATADDIRGSFSNFNASTDIGRTNFIGQMLSDDLIMWLDYIANHIFNPRFDKARFNGEKERVLREISDTKSNPNYKIDTEYNNLFYRGHPKGRFNLGKEEVVKNATQEIIKKFHDRGYHPNNMDLIIVGGLPNNIEEVINNFFGLINKGINTRRDFPELKPLTDKIILHRSAPEIFNSNSPDDSPAQIFLNFLGPANGHENEYAVRIMNQILGGGTNSLLFKSLGLKKGLAYYSDIFYDGDYNYGVLGIKASVPAKRIDESIDTIFEEIKRMKTGKIDDNYVERIKKMAKYHLAKAFESNEGNLNFIEHKLDEELTPESYIDRYNQVNADKIMKVANKYLPDKENGRYILCIRDQLLK